MKNMHRTNIHVQSEYSLGGIGCKAAALDALCMVKRRHFLKQWRAHRGLTQVQLAERLHITQGHLSKVENLKSPWDENLLTLAAEELRCEIVDILIRDPSQPEGIWSIWHQLKPAEQVQLVEVAKVLKKTGTEG